MEIGNKISLEKIEKRIKENETRGYNYATPYTREFYKFWEAKTELEGEF